MNRRFKSKGDAEAVIDAFEAGKAWEHEFPGEVFMHHEVGEGRDLRSERNPEWDDAQWEIAYINPETVHDIYLRRIRQ